jgi:hypothetical protein
VVRDDDLRERSEGPNRGRERSEGPNRDVDVAKLTSPVSAGVSSELDDLFQQNFGGGGVKTPAAQPSRPIPAVKPPQAFPVAAGGGYVTNADLQKMGDQHRAYVKSREITRAQELRILDAFRGLIDMPYSVAASEAKKQGYDLHVLYVTERGDNSRGSEGWKMSRPDGFSKNVIGIRVVDDEFDYEHHRPSSNASIEALVDVGGVDEHDRGKRSVDDDAAH